MREGRVRENPSRAQRAAADLACLEPGVPAGRHLELPGRGTTWIRELEGPSRARPVVLLHGLAATAGLNWAGAFESLAERFRVVAIDHRGHGRGIRTRRFRLEDCADDVAALIAELRLNDPLVVGYSMGGPIATLLWRRHPGAVGGLVLCATSRNFRGKPGEKLTFAALAAAGLSTLWLPERLLLPDRITRQLGSLLCSLPILPPGAKRLKWVVDELAGHQAHAVLQAAGEVGRFDSSRWTKHIDVPASVVAHTNDQVVPVRRQIRLAESIPGASIHAVAAGHGAVGGGPEQRAFVSALLNACAELDAREEDAACRNRRSPSEARFAS